MGKSVDIVVDGRSFPLEVKAKEFSTGSKGFYAWGKIQTIDGKKYQVSANIVEIGSKNSR